MGSGVMAKRCRVSFSSDEKYLKLTVMVADSAYRESLGIADSRWAGYTVGEF